MTFTAIILAAGQGTRMRSDLPKPLHRLAGKPLLDWVLDSVSTAGAKDSVVVVGADGSQVSDYTKSLAENDHIPIRTAIQDPPMGTGHAVEAAKDLLKGRDGIAMIAFADTPLISADCFDALVTSIRDDGHDLCCLGFMADNPTGYGRLITDQHGGVTAIVEEKETDETNRAIRLCNSGLMAVKMPLLFDLLDQIGFNQKTNEKFLTDIIALAHQSGRSIGYAEADEDDVLGINSRVDLAKAESIIQRRLRHHAMMEGATLLAPDTVFLSADTVLAKDVIIHPNVVIGPGVSIGNGAEIKSFSHIEGAVIGPCAVIGPYARLRPGTILEEGVRIGNFVETKNITMGTLAKANHLTYLGDAEIGAGANIGAGTITCNYNGFRKAMTRIGANAFIGSNTALVAPVEIGNSAMIAAGSTITTNVAEDDLVVARGTMKTIKNGAANYRKREKGKT
jgi:bifunctional UDP-N-acetylglucosamine pyrophosphorylase/glucosamine-1-phosphate N-acetyltransferase